MIYELFIKQFIQQFNYSPRVEVGAFVFAPSHVVVLAPNVHEALHGTLRGLILSPLPGGCRDTHLQKADGLAEECPSIIIGEDFQRFAEALNLISTDLRSRSVLLILLPTVLQQILQELVVGIKGIVGGINALFGLGSL